MELFPETMKLIGGTKSKITKDENGEDVPHLWITEVVLNHCNVVNNNWNCNSRVFYTFIRNKSFGLLLDIRVLENQSFHILKYGLLIKTLNH